MQRVLDAYHAHIPSIGVDLLREPVLRLVEHPHVAPGLEQQHRRLDIVARLRPLHGTRQSQRLPHPRECRRERPLMRVVDALLLEPAHAGLARALVIGHIQLRRELTLPEHHVPSQPEPAHRAGKHRRQPVRHTGHRRDHRARQHGLVEQRRMRLQHTRPDAAAHRMAVQVQRTAIRVILAHRLREFRQIGHIPPPIINPH